LAGYEGMKQREALKPLVLLYDNWGQKENAEK
jgi:hypothetical protein